MAADAYASADQAALRIEKRLRRYKRRLKDRHAARQWRRGRRVDAPSYVIAAPDHESEEEVTDFNPVIIAESTTALEQLSVSEAVMELDMTGRAGRGVPPRGERARQHGLPPPRRQHRLGRSAGSKGGRLGLCSAIGPVRLRSDPRSRLSVAGGSTA